MNGPSHSAIAMRTAVGRELEDPPGHGQHSLRVSWRQDGDERGDEDQGSDPEHGDAALPLPAAPVGVDAVDDPVE